jgi:hypothetical protein
MADAGGELKLAVSRLAYLAAYARRQANTLGILGGQQSSDTSEMLDEYLPQMNTDQHRSRGSMPRLLSVVYPAFISVFIRVQLRLIPPSGLAVEGSNEYAPSRGPPLAGR